MPLTKPIVIEPVVLLGAGGHARVLLDALRLCQIPVHGLIAPQEPPIRIAVPYLGDDDQLDMLPRTFDLVLGVGGAATTDARRRLFERAKGLGFRFRTVVHPAAVIAADVVIGEGCQVMAGAVIQCGTHLGVNVLVNTGAVLDHDGRIGDHVHLAPGVVLAGDVVIGSGAFIGTGARVIPGRSIGADTLIGAGAVVVRDIPANVVAYGVPCRVVSARDVGRGAA